METNKLYLGDCYQLIKDIPDKSVDLVYIDIPYLYTQGGGGNSDLGKRTAKKRITLMGSGDKDIDALVNDSLTRTKALSIAKNKAKSLSATVDLEAGIDFSIMDELCRVMKHIYIYIWCSKLQILDLMKFFIDSKDCIFELFI